MYNVNYRAALATVAVATLLGACGGGGGSDAPTPAAPTTDVPASAQQSVSGLLSYLQELIGMTSETSEPILVGTAVLPVDDTAEPAN